MLPKLNRIKKKKDFDLIFKKGSSFKNNLFILKTVKNSLDEPRFGFVVSQKISKKAVIRNKIRRRLSEIARNKMKSIKGGIDIVLISLPGVEKKEFSDIKDSLNNLLIKSKILNV